MDAPSHPPLHESLRAEFDLIQRKIDHIGEFENRVRGWSLTLQTAIIAALFSGKLPEMASGYVTVLLGLPAIGVIFLFHYLEQRQRILSRALGRRAIAIERALDQLIVERDWSARKRQTMMKLAMEDLDGTPRIAVTMALASRQGLFFTVKGMLPFRLNFFYYFEYALTLMALGALCFLRPAHTPEHSLTPAVPVSSVYQINVDQLHYLNDAGHQVQRVEKKTVNNSNRKSQ
jgi:hypothetical protein